jgi:hypothetical protein
MPQNPHSLNAMLPAPTYEVTYKTYLKDYAHTMIPDTHTTKAYHTLPAHVRAPRSSYEPSREGKRMNYEDFKMIKL